MINIEKLAVGYGKTIVIDGFDIQINKGDVISLIGPNGSGKSTILKTISDQLQRIAGTITVDGKELSEIPHSEIGKKMGLLLTEKIKPELMTCFDMVCTGRYPYTGRLGILTDEDREIAMKAMQYVQIEALAEKDFSKISDGQRQRVMIARAICQDTDILILDEPTTYLDINYKLSLMNMVRELSKEQGKTIIMSLHELDLAKIYSDRLICVSGDNRIDRVDLAENVFSGNYIDTLFGMEEGTYKEFLEKI